MRSIVLLLFAALLSSTAFAQNTFYDAYSNGLLLEKQGKFEEARQAFLLAARLHPRPERRIKTYGLNFIRFYDPHSHLAHCEARLEMYEEALVHLEASRKAGVTPKPVLNELELKIRQNLNAKKPDPVSKENEAQPSPTQPPGSSTSEPPQQTEVPAPAEPDFTQKESQPPDLETKAPGPSPTPEKTGVSQQVASVPPAREKEPSDPTALKNDPPVSEPQAATRSDGKESNSKPDGSDIRFRMSRQEIAGLALLICFILAFVWIRFRRKVETTIHTEVESKTAATQLSGTQRRLDRPEDSPTQAIYELENSKRGPTITPVHVDFNEIKKQSVPLKEGTSTDFGAYTLDGILGRGGMGITYLARRKRDGLPVAIKVPHEHLLDNEEFSLRFLREGSLGSTLHHPNIIRIYEAEKLGEQPYIVMELIEGETLEKKLRRDRKLSTPEALELARDIALALDYARLKGVVHRDLKPDNIMILKRGGVKVMDYGIARVAGSGLTSTESYLGTPSYSAPESTTGRVDQQSDLYSLGIILYRMLTGEPPFRSNDPLEVLQMHRSVPLPGFPAELGISEQVYELVRTLAAKSKADRYADAESFLVDLNRVLKQL